MDDIGGYVLAIIAVVGASYTMAMRGHTRVDVFLVRMPPGVQRVLNTLAMVTMAAFAAFAAWRGLDVLQESIEFQSVASNPLQTPLWQPQGLWFIGLALFALISAAYAIHALVLLSRGSPDLNRFYGPSSAQDELEAELTARAERESQADARALHMIDLTAAVVGFALLIGLMSLGLHVAFVMFAISMVGAVMYLGWPAALQFGTQYWGATNNFVLVAIPLFVLLGELLVRGGFTDRMYRSLSDWLNPLPGGLLHTNIGASAMFAAVSGSSVATAATIGTVAHSRFQGTQLRPAPRARHHRGRRDARHPHSAVDQHDHLRRDDQHVGRPPVCGGRHSGIAADRLVHGGDRRRMLVEAVARRAQWRRPHRCANDCCASSTCCRRSCCSRS